MAEIKTYQDFLKIGKDEKKRKDFVRALIDEHKRSDNYIDAANAYEYYCHRNKTINEFQKLLYTVSGKAIPDIWSANFKMASRFFYRFVTQEVQYLLGNGITWGNEDTEAKLGTGRKSIDRQTKSAAKKALWGGQAFGFYDKDHVEVFSYLEYVPLYDEYNGAMMAGVRFWQIDDSHPLRATLYEIDGFTKYVWNTKENLDEPKRAYIQKVASTEADGTEIYDERNYPTFPIVPFWANEEHTNDFVGLREQIDCFDLIKSGFANDVDDASLIYWTINNAGGMTDVDLAKFVQRIKTLHAAATKDEGAQAESHTQDVPYQSREALLDRLEKDLYKDAMALDTERIAGGAATATEILAAYELLNEKCDDFEYQVIDFLNGIMEVAGIEDEPSFTRSQIINQTEMVSVLIQSGQFLSQKYISEKLLTVLGDADRVDEVLSDVEREDIDRFTGGEESPVDEPIEE